MQTRWDLHSDESGEAGRPASRRIGLASDAPSCPFPGLHGSPLFVSSPGGCIAIYRPRQRRSPAWLVARANKERVLLATLPRGLFSA